MTAIRLTAAEAKALGVTATDTMIITRPRQRRSARSLYTSFCYDCGEEFTSRASETRHLDTTNHCRYVVSVAVAGVPPPEAAATDTKAAP